MLHVFENCRLVRVTDGDTLIIDIDLGFGIYALGLSFDENTNLSCRIWNIKADELDTPTGQTAFAFAQTLVKPNDRLKVISHKWDKYGGRYDGEVFLPDGRNFGTEMIRAGHAIYYKF